METNTQRIELIAEKRGLTHGVCVFLTFVCMVFQMCIRKGDQSGKRQERTRKQSLLFYSSSFLDHVLGDI